MSPGLERTGRARSAPRLQPYREGILSGATHDLDTAKFGCPWFRLRCQIFKLGATGRCRALGVWRAAEGPRSC
jgi:hypothetical protein